MSTFDLSQIDTAKRHVTAEVCVIGAGFAGLLLANRIAKAGRRVVVVESGRERFDQQIHDMNAVDDAFARYARELDGRYRGLGGSSSRWGGRLIPINSQDLARRDHIGMPAWPLEMDKLDCYGDEIERLFGVANGPFNELPQKSARIFPTLEQSQALLLRWAKCPSFKMCDVSRALRDELKHNANIEIWLDATVCDFDLDSERGKLKAVVARNFAGKSLGVQASTFVVAAGTIETTRLMLLVDRTARGQIYARQGVMGHYFQDHLKSEVAKIDRRDATLTNRLFAYRYVEATRRDLHLDVAQDAQAKGGAASAFAYIAMDVTNSPLAALKRLAQGAQRRQFEFGKVLKLSKNIGLMAKVAYWRMVEKQLFVPDDTKLSIMLCVEQLPDWKNRISLSSSVDRLGVPKARIEWQPMASEERTFRVGVAQLREFWQAAKLDRTCPLSFSKSAENPESLIIAQSEACAHPSGTTRMGTDPATSIVAPDLRCHAINNVSIVSASVFPTAGSANPTFTIMKLAYFFADSYLARF